MPQTNKKLKVHLTAEQRARRSVTTEKKNEPPGTCARLQFGMQA